MVSSLNNGYRLVEFEPHHPGGASGSRVEFSSILGTWNAAQWQQVKAVGESYSGFAGDRYLGSAGLIPLWPGRAMAWALVVSTVDRRQMLTIHRWVNEFLDEAQQDKRYRRIEASVLDGFVQAQKWVERLGFQREGYMKCYDPDGRDHHLYARVKE